jgi:peroxiredoxin
VRRLTLPLGILALALLSAAGGYLFERWWQPRTVPEVLGPVGETRPDFALADTRGHLHRAKEWDGKVVVINFWATWCPPCLREIPTFIDLQRRFGARGLQFLGVAIDELQSVKRFADSAGMNYPVLTGEQDAIQLSTQLGNSMGVLPFTAIVNRQGKVIHVQVGELSRREAEQVILPLL